MTVLAGETDQTAPPPSPNPTGRRFADLGPRILSGIVLIAVALGTAAVGGRLFTAFWWVASLAVLWEWQRMVGGPRATAGLVVGAVAVTAATVFTVDTRLWPALGVLALGAVAVAALSDPVRRVWVAAGVVYAGSLVVAVSLLRQSSAFGLEAVLWLFAIVWGTDIMAYVGGRVIGGPKLWPRVSPKKTWAGFLVGIGCGSLVGLAAAPVHGFYAMDVVLGIVGGALAQGGDLFESTMKRRFGVKDSSGLIPGHGGVMDRLDGFWAAAVCAAILGVARFGVTTPGAGLFRW